MGNSSGNLNNGTNKILVNYSNRTGAWMNYWTIVIGEYADNIIESSLKKQLIEACALLIKDKNKLNYRNPKLTSLDSDSYVQIQDLIEPSTPSKQRLLDQQTVDETKSSLNQDLMTGFAISLSSRNTKKSLQKSMALNKKRDKLPRFTPTLFAINKTTKSYEIKGEINDLPRFQNVELYTIIEQIFNKMLPNIKRCLSIYPLQSGEHSQSGFGMNKEYESQMKSLHKQLKDQDNAQKFKDSYKVIVKMTDYQFMEKSGFYNGGKFHSEGFQDIDHIKAVALYYFDITDNINGGDLEFNDPTYRHFGGADNVTVNVKDNQCVFFTNMHPFKHRVKEMTMDKSKGIRKGNNDKNGQQIFGTRKLLGFFIVDSDNDEVETTQSVAVNVGAKAKYVIMYWYKMMLKDRKDEMSMDLLKLIESFTFGDIEYRKRMTDECRRLRYEYGKHVIDLEETRLEEERESMRGVCD